MGERLLLHLAATLGSRVDVLDVVPFEGLLVRQVILDFEAEQPPATPAEVRVALMDLIAQQHAVAGGLGNGSLENRASEVKITSRGLVAARALEPGCGRPVRCVTLVTEKGGPMLDARFATGNPELDTFLNASPTVLAVALVVLALAPTAEKPLSVDECTQCVRQLLMHGVRMPPGPVAKELVSPSAVRGGLDKLMSVLSITRSHRADDKRYEVYYEAASVPEIRVKAGDALHCNTWDSYRSFVWHLLRKQPLEVFGDFERRLFPKGRTAAQKELLGETKVKSRRRSEPPPMVVERLADPSAQRPPDILIENEAEGRSSFVSETAE